MKFMLNTRRLESDLMEIRGQHVRVGILNKGKKALQPARPLRRLKLTPTVPRNAATTNGSGKTAKLVDVMAYLNRQRGILDKALEQAGQKDIEEIADLFVRLVLESKGDALLIQKLENVCKAIIRNPIIRKEYGPNAESTAAKKEFDHYGVNTGTLMKNIEAKYGSD